MDYIIRKILYLYRLLLDKLYKKESYGVMQIGVENSIENHHIEKYKGDVIHPCVRYCEKPFRGHQWWLIYTPYYSADPSVENPILCFGDSEDGKPPTKWFFESLIRDTPELGYNSDPTLIFANECMYVFWRENDTKRVRDDNCFRATYGMIYSESEASNIKNPVLIEEDKIYDKEVSPTIIHYSAGYRAYAAHLRFKNGRLHFRNKILERFSITILWILSVLEIYSEQKSLGISIWDSSSLEEEFKYLKTVKIDNCNKLYRPWHFDFFEYCGKLYVLIQTNKSNADICLGVSDDYEHFRMYKKPLVTANSINKAGIYKTTGLVQNDILYLYYTAQDLDNRRKNKLYCTQYPMKQLLEKIDQ